jgi:hypothetical protein
LEIANIFNPHERRTLPARRRTCTNGHCGTTPKTITLEIELGPYQN